MKKFLNKALPKFSYPRLEPYNFGGLTDQNYHKARIVILPVPYSSTTYWKSQTEEGPRAIIEASRHLELYDEELKKDFSKIGIYTLEELEASKNSPKETILRIEKVISQVLEDQKFPLMLGGEHSITLGAVMAFKKKFQKLSILQFDAHTDLRDEFEGTKFHHGCVMRRIVEDLKLPVTQVGIRSLSKEEADFLEGSKKNNVFYAPNLSPEEIINTLKENVYLTIDLDVLDPSIMPAVSLPEPDGLSWQETLDLLKRIARERKIVGADVVELSPIPGFIAPDFLAAKLVYKIINFIIG